ncbi:hypothetical protein [uncultured Oxalobacter sp.]|uniref:phage head-tail joining protein n=1 Tax=uncultured Oxalobacter sp. TaxID=337245 RepID=UPI0025995DD7|nr:hypothetical protein [uncultured Oxalobacter sp.]
MAFTVEQFNAVEKALANGLLEVDYGGKRVRYRTTDELLRVRNLMRSELAASGLISGGNSNRGAAALAIFSRD